MTEAIIESRLIETFAAALSAADIDSIQIIGAWQQGAQRSIESAAAKGYLTVKVMPRQFDTYTIADGSMSVQLNLDMRAELDPGAADYLAVTDAVSAVVYGWQRSFTAGAAVFNIENSFSFTGFRLDGGDCGIDHTESIWSWSQPFTIQGIFNN